ncbi:MAG: hypothetical protein IJG56_03680, partial [Clostridia bacterium]|nr:hypothetical protein [Clostridia bacterium]
HQVYPVFSILPEQKRSRSKLRSTTKERFLCRARRKAQEYWLCIPSIFNEARREKFLLRLPCPFVNAPFRMALLLACAEPNGVSKEYLAFSRPVDADQTNRL